MTGPMSPKLLRAGLVVVDPDDGSVTRVITLQYNPDTMTRGFQIAGAGEGAAQGEASRLTGPPAQTLTIEAELDATDALADPEANADAGDIGLAAQLAAIEALVWPPLASVVDDAALMASGALEILPPPSPIVLFAMGPNRIAPVRITELAITEEAFDPKLNPIRAKVRLGLRVLTTSDVGTGGRLGGYALAAHQQLEELSKRALGGRLTDLGISKLP
jgi:hypothetical protein